MKALRFHAAKDLRIEDIEAPDKKPAPGQVRIRNKFVGICGTDLHEYAYGPIFVPTEPHPFTGAHGPQILGHEYGGVVDAIGEGVTSVKPGDRISVSAADHAAQRRLLFRSRAVPFERPDCSYRFELGVRRNGGRFHVE